MVRYGLKLVKSIKHAANKIPKNEENFKATFKTSSSEAHTHSLTQTHNNAYSY